MPRSATVRHYVMCPPTEFTVDYAINPWMDTSVAVDPARAMQQWRVLHQTYLDLGHTVEVMDPEPGLPDMVFAANGALVIGARALQARFAFPQRRDEAHAHARFLEAAGVEVHEPVARNEGEGDFLVVGQLVLAGVGPRTEKDAHAEAEAVFGRQVLSLELVDPRFYHLDTCLGVLDDETIAYYPPAFSFASRTALERHFPDAVIADESDADVLGLNFVSDGRNVVLADRATGLADQLSARGYLPLPLDLSELVKAGGNVKCCTLERYP